MITTTLYNNTIGLNFEEKRHRFTINGKPIISVTRATGVIDKPALKFWAVKMGAEFLMANIKKLKADTSGTEIMALIDESKKQHTIFKDKAATSGTKVHEWAEGFIKAKGVKKNIPPMPKEPEVLNGVTAFLKWVTEHKVEFLSSERYIYSKKYNYAGIMDAEAIIDGKKRCIDFKTSSGIYPEMRFQVSGYQGAAEEEQGWKYDGDKILARFDKVSGDFEAHEFSEHKKDFKAFLAALTLRRRLMELK